MIRILVPATTANVGPGFDTMGIALSLCNRFDVEVSDSLEISGCDVEFANSSNLFYVAYKKACEILGSPSPEIHLHIDAEIPMTRGLGSSAAMIVGGVCTAAIMARGTNLALSPILPHFGKSFFNENELQKILEISAFLEGHPDNVSSAIFGGYQVSIMDSPSDGSLPEITRSGFEIDESLSFNALVPSFKLETKTARAVLPTSISMRDAVFSVGHAALTALAFAERNYDMLAVACRDRLHQPFRQTLIPGWDEIVSASESAGALAVWLSGAGPTIIALTRHDADSFYATLDPILKRVTNITGHVWKRLRLTPDNRGLAVEII
jgi:homoserine kinase